MVRQGIGPRSIQNECSSRGFLCCGEIGLRIGRMDTIARLRVSSSVLVSSFCRWDRRDYLVKWSASREDAKFLHFDYVSDPHKSKRCLESSRFTRPDQVRCWFASGEGNGHCSASAKCAGNGNLSAVGVNDGLADAQTQAAAGGGLRTLARLVHSVKPLKHLGQVVGRNALPGVADQQLDP